MPNNTDYEGERVCKGVLEGLCQRLGSFQAEVAAYYDLRDQEWWTRIGLGNGTNVYQRLNWVTLNKDLDELASKIVEAI